MVGYDPDWVDAGNRRFTSYTNLPPGEYIFQVTGSNNDGLWNEKPAEVQVTVFLLRGLLVGLCNISYFNFNRSILILTICQR